MKSKVAAVGALLMASGAFAGGTVPPGWMEVADSDVQFSETQGQDGWRYLFDRGAGTPAEPMPYMVTGVAYAGRQRLWCTAPNFANAGSFCGIGHLQMSTNTPSSCSSPQGGFRRPIREWSNPTPLRARLVLSGDVFTEGSSSVLVDLQVNGTSIYSVPLVGPNTNSISVSFDVAQLSKVALVIDPLDGSCHSDNTALTLRILTPDCPADVVQNGFVDGSDLAAVLSVWGTSGGIYPRADTNGDGIVDGSDLATVLGGWGACP